MNDAVVARGQLSKTIDLHLTLDGDEISKYRADGLLCNSDRLNRLFIVGRRTNPRT